MPATELVCLQPFTAWDTSFVKGDVIQPETYSSWPGKTLQNRLKNGYVEFVSKEFDTEVAGLVQTALPVPNEEAVGKMTKAELVEIAKGVFDVELDPKLGLEVLRRQLLDLIAAGANRA